MKKSETNEILIRILICSKIHRRIKLPQQDEVDKVQILMDDAHIYNRLREEWKDKLQQTAH